MGRKLQILLVIAFFLAVTALSTYFFWMRSAPAVGEFGSVQADGKIHVLVIGVDNANGGRSDALLVASLDPKTKEVSLLSIPRDARVRIPGRGYDKINHAYAYGGISLTLQTVREFLNVPIRYYVRVDTAGLVKLVDAIGGVPIDVEKRMYYVDEPGDLYIDLHPGPQTLTGAQAEGYVRYRWDDSDFHRTQRQQKFIKAALKQLLRPANIFKLPELIQLGLETVNSNIPMGMIIRYMPLAGSLQLDSIKSTTVPCNGKYIDGIYYAIPDEALLAQIVDEYFYSGLKQEANSQVRVSVQYGNGQRSSAEPVAELLRRAGFDVVEIAPADRSDYQVSQVISRKKDTAGAISVAEALSLPEVLLDTTLEGSADVVVIIAQDMLP
jgi:LCP family protein required for cell wall assembly